jgi:hypothetical protein
LYGGDVTVKSINGVSNKAADVASPFISIFFLPPAIGLIIFLENLVFLEDLVFLETLVFLEDLVFLETLVFLEDLVFLEALVFLRSLVFLGDLGIGKMPEC